MAESASGGTLIGKISLDIEMGGNLKEQMMELTQNLQKQLSQTMQQPIKKLFEDMAKSMTDSLRAITDEVRNMMAASKKELEDYLKRINNVKMPNMPAPGDTTQPSQETPGSIMPRAPPASVSYPKLKIDFDIEQQKELINSQLAQIEAQMGILKNKSNELEDAMQKALKTDPAAAEMYEAKLKQIGAQMVDLEIKAEALNAKLKEISVPELQSMDNGFSGLSLGTLPTTELEQMKLSMREIWQLSSNLFPSLETLSYGMRNVGSAIKEVARVGGKSILSGFTFTLKEMTHLLPKCVQKLLPFNKALKESKSNAHSSRFSFKRLLGTLVVFRLLMPAITKGIQSMFSTLSQSLQTNDQFSKSLKQIKSNLSVAFTPIFQAILPAVNALMVGLSKITAYLAAFTSTLFGSSLSASVAATKQLNAQKQALSGVGGAAKKASLQLASFDELNIIGQSEDSGGAALPEITMPEINTSGISDFAQKLKDLIDAGDWYGVGALLGEKLSDALDQINWAPIQNKAAEIGRNLAELINGFIEFPGLGMKIGENLGEALNVAVEFFYNFVKRINWKSLGKFIGDGFTGIFKRFNWSKFGSSIGLFVGGWVQMMATMISSADLSSLGEGLSVWAINLCDSFAQRIRETDWDAVGQSFAEGFLSIDFGGILSSVAIAIGEAVLASVGIIRGFFSNIGWDSIQGLLEGIIMGLANIGTWLIDNVINPLVDGVCSLLGIHSPSTVFAEIGNNIILGLFEGLKGLWETVNGWFKEKFKLLCDGIQTKFTEVKKFFDTTVKKIGDFFGELAHNIGDGFKRGINWAIEHVNRFIGWLNEKLKFSWDPLYIMGHKIYDGGSVQLVTIPQIPYLAQGGIIDQPTLAMVGESGKEAVMPLENNTGWIDQLADRVAARLPQGNSMTSAQLDLIIELLRQLLEKSGDVYLMDEIVGIIGEAWDRTKGRRGDFAFNGINR